MSCASFLGSGHRIEFYGEEGTLVLANPTSDYFDGFELKQARRSDRALQQVAIETAGSGRLPDSRIAPVPRLVARFLDACEGGPPATPGFAEGYRVQLLIDAARRAHESGLLDGGCAAGQRCPRAAVSDPDTGEGDEAMPV